MSHLDEHGFCRLLDTLARGEGLPQELAADDRADLALASRLLSMRVPREAPSTPPWAGTAAPAAGVGAAGRLAGDGSTRGRRAGVPPTARRRWALGEALAVGVVAVLAAMVVARRAAPDRTDDVPRLPLGTTALTAAVGPGLSASTPSRPGAAADDQASPTWPARAGDTAEASDLGGGVAPVASSTFGASAAAQAATSAPSPSATKARERPAQLSATPRDGPTAPPPTAGAPPSATAEPGTATSAPPAPGSAPTPGPTVTRPPSSTPFLPTATAQPPPGATPTPAVAPTTDVDSMEPW